MNLGTKVAMDRYRRFVGAMDMVTEALDECDKLIKKVKSKEVNGVAVATQSELSGFRQTAINELETLREIAKKHEADLVSREWRL